MALNLTSWVAKPLDGSSSERVRGSVLWHFTKPEHIDKIVAKVPEPGTAAEMDVHLSAPNGWSINVWKLLRDASVWDTQMRPDDYMKYLYFFLNEPSQLKRSVNVQNAPFSIRIKGEDLLARCPNRVFFRSLDDVVVIRGDYRGPGIVGA